VRVPDPPLLVITDRAAARHDLVTVAERAFAAGCRWLMLREKDVAPDALRRLAGDLAPIAHAHGARLVVHGIAVAGTDGVHLPAGRDVAAMRRTIGPDALLGASTHDADAVSAAAAAGADYVTLSPVFVTASKPGYGPALGVAPLGSIARRAPIPVIALGGIDAGNAGACMAAGAAGVAVMGGVMRADDPGAVVARLVAAIRAERLSAR